MLSIGWQNLIRVKETEELSISSPVVKPVWQLAKCLYTRYNRLSNPFDNRLYCVYKHSTGCQTRFDYRLYRVCSRLSNRLYNPVWQPVERTVAVRSTRELTVAVHSTWLSNRVWQLVERTVVQHIVSDIAIFVLKRDVKLQLTSCSTRLSSRLYYPVGQLVEQTVAVRSTRLSIDNRIDNRLDVCLHDTAGCQTSCTTCLTTGLATGCETGCIM